MANNILGSDFPKPVKYGLL